MSNDLFVGFERKLTGLKAFLAGQGYTRLKSHGSGYYEWEGELRPTPISEEEPLPIDELEVDTHPTICYTSRVTHSEDPEDKPNWRMSGRDIVSDIEINYPLNMRGYDEVRRLAKVLAKEFNGIIYEPHMDEFYTADDFYTPDES